MAHPTRRDSVRPPRTSMRMAPALDGLHSQRLPMAEVTDSVQIPRDLYSLKVHAVLPFDEQRLSIAEAPVGAPTSICEPPMPVDGAATGLSHPDTFDEEQLPMADEAVGASAAVHDDSLPEAGAPAEAPLDFSDPDTFDTFGSPNRSEDNGVAPDESFAEFETPEKNDGALPGLHQEPAAGEQPTFPDIKPFLAADAARAQKSEDDDDGDVYDIPRDMMAGSGGGRALRELQCASVKAGNELAEQVRKLESQQKEAQRLSQPQKISRAQGELELRSRFLRRWNTRYASIVDHAMLGAVLFLFCGLRAARGGQVALKASKMIVLAESTVRELEGARKTGPSFFFELKTAQRKYVFACVDNAQRKYWLENLSSLTRP